MGLEYRFSIPQTFCEKWPVGCQFCDLLLCDGKIETALMRQKCDPCKPTQPECGECEFSKPITNADSIRSMTDEELAERYGTHACCMNDPFFCDKPGGSWKKRWLDWLQEASDG